MILKMRILTKYLKLQNNKNNKNKIQILNLISKMNKIK